MNIKLIFKYYWPHLKRYKKSGLLVFAAYAIGVVGDNVLSPLLYKRIVDLVTNTSDPSLVISELIGVLILIAIVLFTFQSFYRIGDFALSYSQSRILKDLTDESFKKLQKHSYEFFSNTFGGSLVAKVRRYVRSFETIHDQFIFAAWMNGLKLIFAVIVLTWFSLLLGAMMLVFLVLYIFVTAIFIRIKIKKDLLAAEANSKVTGSLSDAITNILNIKMFATRHRESDSFKKVTDEEEARRRDAWYFQNIQFAAQALLITIFEVVGMSTAVYLWSKGAISSGTIVLMQIYVFSAFGIVWHIGRNFSRTIQALAEAKEMVDIFEQSISVEDIKSPEPINIEKGSIEIKDITFAYGENDSVFRSLSLDISDGEKVAFVGPSGAGKTTVTKLLLRFADIKEGEILIDGQNIAHIKQDDLRSKIAYVPQEPILFHRTLKENITYARPNATEEEVFDVAKQAHAHDFIGKLPEGYETLVGERGIKLSGGERQRVAIARAMLKDAPILILDEATSSLDSISEKHIQDAFNNLMEGRTTIVIAHRLSTIQKMDRIIVFEDGKIIEEGKHEELLKEKGLYFKLWEQQSHGFIT